MFLSFLTAFPDHAARPLVPTGPGGEAVTDAYTFVHPTLAGDGTLTARVTSLSGAHTSPSPATRQGAGGSSKGGPSTQLHPGPAPWAKAGIILEPDTRQETAYAAVMVTGSHGVRMQYDCTHDSPGITGLVGPSSPRWLRLTRAGGIITGYDSTDGARYVPGDLSRTTSLEPEVRDWLDGLSGSDLKRVDELAGMLAEKGPGLGGPFVPSRARVDMSGLLGGVRAGQRPGPWPAAMSGRVPGANRRDRACC